MEVAVDAFFTDSTPFYAVGPPPRRRAAVRTESHFDTPVRSHWAVAYPLRCGRARFGWAGGGPLC